MSRRPSSSVQRTPSAASAPYPRRTPGQPKSTRQQFSACGACRMRRVRCDLKDFHSTTSPSNLQHPSCSNCRERNIRCVDEFAEVKAVKLLRRGRRLQQVEARYGKVSDEVSTGPSGSQSTPAVSAATTGHSCIPEMQLPFLTSSFFRRFCVQRPVIEPGEFTSRYTAHIDGTAPLDIEGKMLAMLLVTWAASFGIDEYGCEDSEDLPSESHGSALLSFDGDDKFSNAKRQARMLHTEAMTREILTLVDLHGLLRRPSWDGVRVLLLLLPLTHDIQSPIEHLTTYKATLAQVHALCNDDDAPSIDSGLGLYCDVLVRARVFWYAHVHEGISVGLNGGRFILDDNDLDSFQSSLPPQFCATAAHSITSPPDSPRSSPSASSPGSPTFPFVTPLEPSHPRATLAYLVTTQYFSLALAVSQACRAICLVLTSPNSRRRIESGVPVREQSVVEIWDELERCWENFEALRRNPTGVGAAGGDIIRGEDVERFVSGWQVFIFGCLNVIREALPVPTENNRTTPEQAVMRNLHLSAVQRCRKYLPQVIEMLQRHLKVPSSFFAYDTGLIRDGCFFAGLLLAQGDKLDTEEGGMGYVDWEEGVGSCLQALGEIRWIYSHSEEQEKALKAEWEARMERDSGRQHVRRSPNFLLVKQSPGHSPCLDDDAPLPCSSSPVPQPQTLSLVAAGGQVRPPLPPLSVTFSHDDSGPETALTDGSGSWEPYTPPSTSTSVTGTAVTHGSLSPIPSPHHHSITRSIPGSMKIKGPMFGDDSDDQFSFVVGGTPVPPVSGVQDQWAPFGGDFLDPHVMLTSDAVLGCDGGFSPLASNRRSYYS